jgi:hypothetical protein
MQVPSYCVERIQRRLRFLMNISTSACKTPTKINPAGSCYPAVPWRSGVLSAKTSADQSAPVGASRGGLRLSQFAKWANLAPKRRSKRTIPTLASKLLTHNILH